MDTIYHTEYIEFTNKKGMKVVFCNYGAQVYSITLGEDVVSFTLWNRSEQMKYPNYYGKTIGPITGRIPGGIINGIDGKNIHLKNKKNEGNNILHFSEESLAYSDFEYTKEEKFGYYKIHFKKDYVDEINNHLFDALVEIIYIFYKRENKLEMIQRVTPKKDTYYSLTNHLFFCLSRKERVTKATLQINADKVGVLDENKLLKGYAEVNDVFDFRKPKLIGEDIYKVTPGVTLGYDHPYLLNNSKGPQIIMKAGKRSLNITTDYDAVYIYTNNNNDIHERMLQRDYNKRYDGIAIEPQIEPGNFNKMFIKANTTREYHTIYEFKEEKK